MTIALSADAAVRFAAIESYDVPDTPAEQGFDDLVAIAASVCATPVALVAPLPLVTDGPERTATAARLS